jgi:hypothetical protein
MRYNFFRFHGYGVYAISISGRRPTSDNVGIGSIESGVIENIGVGVENMKICSFYNYIPDRIFFSRWKGFFHRHLADPWNSAMHDAPKDYILYSLPSGENRTEKFLPVLKIYKDIAH